MDAGNSKNYTRETSLWLAKIFDYKSGPEPNWKPELRNYLLSRVRTSDRQARLGRKKSSEKILEEYLSLTDALKTRERHYHRLSKITIAEIMNEFRELVENYQK